MRLTKRTVDEITAPASGYALHWDDEIKGFGLRVTAAGKKTYIMQRRTHGRDRRFTLGTHGSVTVEQARKDAKIKAGLIASGGDPVADKKRAALATKTLAEVLADYGEARNAITDSTRKEMAGVLKRYSADWLKKPVTGITPDRVLARHRKIGRETPASANKWGRYLRALLTFAAGRYTDTEGQPILADNAVKVLSRARS